MTRRLWSIPLALLAAAPGALLAQTRAAPPTGAPSPEAPSPSPEPAPANPVPGAIAEPQPNPTASPEASREREPPRAPEAIDLAPGYGIDLVASGLDAPTAVAARGGTTWIAESGIARPGSARIREIGPQGDVAVVLSQDDLPRGRLVPPISSLVLHGGELWIAHRQIGENGWPVGAISRFRPSDAPGTFQTVVTNLPSAGDHGTGALLVGRDGRMYFGQGTATNTGVVGPDNDSGGWLAHAPTMHDFPPRPLTPTGEIFVAPNPLTGRGDMVLTAPFRPFGSGLRANEQPLAAPSPKRPVEGMIAGNGAVYSFAPFSQSPPATMRLEAWGLRDPAALAVDPASPNRLLVLNRGATVRSERVGDTEFIVESRPVSNDRDDLFALYPRGATEFFGWPDFFHDPDTGKPRPVTDPTFCETVVAPRRCPDFVAKESLESPPRVPPAVAQIAPPSTARALAITPGGRFGRYGDIVVAQSFFPAVDLPLAAASARREGAAGPPDGESLSTPRAGPVTGRIFLLDRRTGDTMDLAAGRLPTSSGGESLGQPAAMLFHRGAMLVVDMGERDPETGALRPGTGKLWSIAAEPARSPPRRRPAGAPQPPPSNPP